MGTPKQTLFFKPIYEELIRRGIAVDLITRDNPEALALQQYYKLPTFPIGGFGKTKEEKLLLGIQRQEKLYQFMSHRDITGLINFVEPNSSRVAFGLDIPIFTFIDMPESKKVCQLTIALSEWTFIPFCVPRDTIMHYGARQIYVYPCLDPMIWLPKKTKKLQMDRPFITYRPAETEASYYEGFKDITNDIIEELRKDKVLHLYPLPRYQGHKIVDLPSLLANSDLFIGGGGTIQIEAAYYGTWTITTRPFSTYYDTYMLTMELMSKATTVQDGVRLAKGFLEQPSKNVASEVLRKMKFPLREVVDKIVEYER